MKKYNAAEILDIHCWDGVRYDLTRDNAIQAMEAYLLQFSSSTVEPGRNAVMQLIDKELDYIALMSAQNAMNEKYLEGGHDWLTKIKKAISGPIQHPEKETSVEPAAETQKMRPDIKAKYKEWLKDTGLDKDSMPALHALNFAAFLFADTAPTFPPSRASIQQEAIPEDRISLILKLSEWLNKELVWQVNHVKNSPREFHKGALSAFESVAAKILELTAVQPSAPPIKTERDDIPISPAEARRHIPEGADEWCEAHQIYYKDECPECTQFSTAVAQREEMAQDRVIECPVCEAAWNISAVTRCECGAQIIFSEPQEDLPQRDGFMEMVSTLDEHGLELHPLLELASRPSPTVQEGEIPDFGNVWDAWEGFEEFNREAHGNPAPDGSAYSGENIRKNYAVIRKAAAERGAKWMRDALRKRLEQQAETVVQTRKENASLQSQLYNSQQELIERTCELVKNKEEAYYYRDALVRLRGICERPWSAHTIDRIDKLLARYPIPQTPNNE